MRALLGAKRMWNTKIMNSLIGRPRKDHGFPIEWEIEATLKDGNKKTVKVYSGKQLGEKLNELLPQCKNGHFPKQKETRFRYVAYIPFIYGKDEDSEPVYDYKRKQFKAKTLDEARERAEQTRDAILGCVPSWRGSVSPNGLTEVDRKRAERLIAEQERELGKVRAKYQVPTIGQLVEQHLTKKEKRRQAEGSTVEMNRIYLRKHIMAPTIPDEDPSIRVEPFVLGNIRVTEAKQEHLREFADSLSRKKSERSEGTLAPKTVRNIVSLVRSAWRELEASSDYADAFRRLHFEERHLPLPKEEIVRPNLRYSPQEVESLISACRDGIDRALLALALIGLRPPGEVCGCKWEDFCEHAGERFVNVTRQIDHVKGKRIVKGLKTGKKGQKALPVSLRMWEMLQEAKAFVEKANSPFVLRGTGGEGDAEGSLSPSSVQEKFLNLKKLAGIEREGATLYALRHTVLSEARRAHGMEKAQLIAGHTSSRMIDRHYDQNIQADLLRGVGNTMPWDTPPVSL